MSRGVEEIRMGLDAMASDYSEFGLKLNTQPTYRGREEISSCVCPQDIIGREHDVENIVGKLLDPDVQQGVSCLTISGVGGLGKSTLARLIYNDPRIKENFHLRLWTCVSNRHQVLEDKAIICKILYSATGQNHERFAMDHLQIQLREELPGKKYFLVLDDVWNEDLLQWANLKEILMSGLKGSWVVVTTRSQELTRIVENESIYELKGLLEEDSWHLFERTAFGQRHEEGNPPDLVEIGREIVKKCSNVPLVIRVLGSLLYGQERVRWLWCREVGLRGIKQGENDGTEILKLSYHQLESRVKTCFNYCALFPEGHVIVKDKLIDLWMAQNYIVPVQEGQNAKDAGNEYFLILIKRCFFQDLRIDAYGEVVSCRINSQMHNIAQLLEGMEFCTTNTITTSLGDIRHLSYMSMDESTERFFTVGKIRTFLRVGWGEQRIPVDRVPWKWRYLRALDLSKSRIERFPVGFGKLLHLRYLDLSHNGELEKLPESIEKLQNLQTLSVRECGRLKELPKSLPTLAALRTLDMYGCWMLNGLPQGMRKLRWLLKLPLFVAGDRNSTSRKSVVDHMKDLKALRYLKGSLHILFLNNIEYDEESIQEGDYIRNKEHLDCVKIEFSLEDGMNKKGLLEDLQPHPNLKELELFGYGDRRIPGWARNGNLALLLPNLVTLKLIQCARLQHLPSLGKLHNLKFLEVCWLYDLEYMENTTSMGSLSDGVGGSELNMFFPCLEQLKLNHLPKLKGWRRDDEIVSSRSRQQHCLLPSFLRLSMLIIWECPELTFIPPCPTVDKLLLLGKFNKRLEIMVSDGFGHSKLKDLKTGDVGCLKSILPLKAFRSLKSMEIYQDYKVESFVELRDVFRSCSSSLRSLTIKRCTKLKSVCGLEHLTALEKLDLRSLPKLNMNNDRKGDSEGEIQNHDEMPWHCLRHCLHSLTITNLPQMVNLPKGMCYLTSLQYLRIVNCKRLKSLPESMQELRYLKRIDVYCSASLKERC